MAVCQSARRMASLMEDGALMGGGLGELWVGRARRARRAGSADRRGVLGRPGQEAEPKNLKAMERGHAARLFVDCAH